MGREENPTAAPLLPAESPEARFGHQMRRERESAGMSLRELARRLTRSHSNLWDYERGHRLAPEEIAADYERALGLEPGRLRGPLEEARLEIYGPDRSRRRPFRPPALPGPPHPSGPDQSEPVPSGPDQSGPVRSDRAGPAPGGQRPGDGFVGRDGELASARAWLAEAVGGDVRVVLFRGEAGIGKSTLLAQLVADGRDRGCTVLAGTCREGVSVPYLPMATALRPVLEPSASTARGGERTGPLDVFLGATPAGAPDQLDASTDRSRLMLFYTAAQALLAAVDRSPHLLAIEDLHWADEATLGLLDHLVATATQQGALSPTPLVVAVTTRTPVPGSAADRAVRRLEREAGYREVTLGGFDELGVNHLVRHLAGVPPSRPLLRSLVTATGGNPMLVRTVLRRLTEGGEISRRDERLVVHGDRLPGAVELDAELTGRFERTDADCRNLLEVAAALGGNSLAELRAVTGTDEVAFDARLDAAIASGLLVEEGDTYRFDHPRIGEVIGARLSPRRSVHVHRSIAERLELHYGARADGQAPVIAHHLRLAGPAAPERMVRHYPQRAADMAFAVAAWGESAQHYDMALAVADPDDPAVDELELRAAIAHFRDHNHPAAEDRLGRVIDRARRRRDTRLWGRAVLALAKSRTTGGAALDATTAPIEEFLASVGDAHADLEARAWAELANAHFAVFDFAGGMERAARALACAGRADDSQVGAEVEVSAGIQHLALLQLDEAEGSFERSVVHAGRLDDPWALTWGHARLPLVRWVRGDLAAADGLAARAAELATGHFDWAESSLALACRTGVAAAQGRFADAERFGALGYQQYLRSDYVFGLLLLAPSLVAARAFQGDGPGARKAVDMVAAAGIGPERYQQVVAAMTGATETVREQLRANPPAPRDPAGVTLFDVPFLALEAEIGDLLGDAALLAGVAPSLEAAAAKGVEAALGWVASVQRLLGVCALGLGQLPLAARRLEGAIETARSAGAPVEAARAGYDLARVRRAEGTPQGRRAAADLLAPSIEAFRRHGTYSLLRRAQLTPDE